MPRECTICKKRGMLVNNRKKLRASYNPTGKKRQSPNLQKAYISKEITRKEYREYRGKKVKMCSKCRKTMLKNKR